VAVAVRPMTTPGKLEMLRALGCPGSWAQPESPRVSVLPGARPSSNEAFKLQFSRQVSFKSAVQVRTLVVSTLSAEQLQLRDVWEGAGKLQKC